MISDNITYYANYSKSISANYFARDNSMFTRESGLIAISASGERGKLAVILPNGLYYDPEDPTKRGSGIDGWCLGSANSEIYEFGETVAISDTSFFYRT